MVQSQGTAKNLNEGSQESMRALIQALVPEASLNSEGKLNGDVVERLSEKLSQLVGPDAVQDDQAATRNERGELLNEEGLPIIDINEPVSLTTKLKSPGSIPPLATVEPLLPLATLPPPVRDRLRERRNRILDALEKEDEEEQLRQGEEEDEEMQKRKQEVAREKDIRKDTRELQKKMGRALIQNIGKDRKKEEEKKEAQRLLDEEAEKRRSPSIKKKTVAFAESAEIAEEESKGQSFSEDWGDVVPARLHGAKRPTLLSQALLDKHPMKMSVVERVPGGQLTIPKQPPTLSYKPADSDDESDEGNNSDNEEYTDVDPEPTLDEDVVDLDYAQHQREIALQYYRKRSTIGQAATAAMMNHSHDADEVKVPDVNIVQDSEKPNISQFKATRIASAYGASITTGAEMSATSLAGSVLPASSARTIQRAIRTGKLDDNGKLIGGDDDSASEEEDQGLQEVLDLLRKGEVYNLGPDGNYVHAVRPNHGSSPLPVIQNNGTAESSSTQTSDSPKAPIMPPPNMRPKTSKFKASLATPGRPSASTSSPQLNYSNLDILSPSATPASHVGRSSPKMVTPPPIFSIVPERAQSSSVKSPSPSKSPDQSTAAFSVIVNSPSFPIPQEPSSHNITASTGTPATMIISSPSFPPPSSSRRQDRPPQVLATHVTESRPVVSQHTQGSGDSSTFVPKKVSRFKADRM